MRGDFDEDDDAPGDLLDEGDVVVSKFGNRWIVEARDIDSYTGKPLYVLRNRPREIPDATGTVYSGPLPAWVKRIIPRARAPRSARGETRKTRGTGA